MSLTTRIVTSAHILEGVEAGSVQAIITSTPYFHQRIYRAPDTDWPAVSYRPMPDLDVELTIPEWTGQLGQEATVAAFIGHLVLCLRRWREVLREDGTVWLNLGDSYAQDSKWGGQSGEKNYTSKNGGYDRGRLSTGIKDKNVLLIPTRLALAAQADGWIVRNVIPWIKKNGLPGPWDDRFIVGHEDILLLSKNEDYFFDHIAIRRPGADYRRKGGKATYTADGAANHGVGSSSFHQMAGPNGRNARTTDLFLDSMEAIEEELHALRKQGGMVVDDTGELSGMIVNPESFRGAHYAVFPEKLARGMIMAATPEQGSCALCGAPFVRQIYREVIPHDGMTESTYDTGTTANRLAMVRQAARERGEEYSAVQETVGWRPTCICNAPEGMQPADLELIASPFRQQGNRDDPTNETGRAGLNRERKEGEGKRIVTRYEQRHYAKQLKQSPHRKEMEGEAGKQAFAHYLRTDRKGARPIPPPLLEKWIDAGWIHRVELPAWPFPPTRPSLVVDPFAGSGTTGRVAARLSRRCILTDVSDEYMEGLAAERTNVQMELL